MVPFCTEEWLRLTSFPACLAYFIHLDPQLLVLKPTIEHWHMRLPPFHIHAEVVYFLA